MRNIVSKLLQISFFSSLVIGGIGLLLLLLQNPFNFTAWTLPIIISFGFTGTCASASFMWINGDLDEPLTDEMGCE